MTIAITPSRNASSRLFRMRKDRVGARTAYRAPTRLANRSADPTLRSIAVALTPFAQSAASAAGSPYPGVATGVPPAVTLTAQYLNSGILPKGSSTGLVSRLAAAS